MDLEQLKTKTNLQNYSETIAASLLACAQKDIFFAEFLRDKARKLKIETSGEYLPEKRLAQKTGILLCDDTYSAIRRTEWLFNGHPEHAQSAKAMIAEWEKGQPKQLVVGVVQVAIPGVTLGRWKKRRKMALIVNKRYINNLTTPALARAPLDVMDRELQIAQNNIKKLEPEVSDWFFGDKRLKFMQAGPSSLKALKLHLEGLYIPHSAIERRGSIEIIAVSPSVNLYELTAYYDLAPAELKQL